MKPSTQNIQSFLRPHVPRAPISQKSITHKAYSTEATLPVYQLQEDPVPFGAGGVSAVADEAFIPPMLAPQSTEPEFFLSNLHKALLVSQGIQKVSFENFKKEAALDYSQMAWLLDCARNTLINKKGTDVFDATISEKLVSLAEVYTRGIDVFGSLPTMLRWLQNPNRAMGGVTPFSLLQSAYGRAEVLNILGRIEWGVYS